MSLPTDLINRSMRIDPPGPKQERKPERWHTKMEDSKAEPRGLRGLLDLLFQQLRDHRDDPGQEPIDVDKALSILTERNDKPALLPAVEENENARTDLLKSLAARCLVEIDGLSEEPDDQAVAERLARAWRWLRDKCWPASSSPITTWVRSLTPVRGQPSALDETRSLLREIRGSCRRHNRIYFPTIGDAQVMVLRLTELEAPAGVGSPLPPLQLAPWSVYGLDSSSHGRLKTLATELSMLRRDAPAPPVPFLLELFPAGEDYEGRGDEDTLLLRPPATLQVAGNSLGLAFCLAVWAINHGMSLRRMCVTGSVTERGDVARVDMSKTKEGSTTDKVTNAVQFFGRLGKRVIFLMPEVNHPENFLNKLPPTIVINGRTKHEQIKPLNHLRALLGKDQRGLLTDCFDDYRDAAAGWASRLKPAAAGDGYTEEDVRTFRGLIDRAWAALNASRPEPIPDASAACLFNEPPADAAKFVIADLVNRIQAREEEQPGFAADDCPVPLPLHLERLPADPADTDGRAVSEAVRLMLEEDFGFATDRFFRSVLENTIGYSPEKVLMVVFGAASLDGEQYEAQERRLEGLLRYVNGGDGVRSRARLICVASDYHHQLFLRHTLGERPATAAAPA